MPRAGSSGSCAARRSSSSRRSSSGRALVNKEALLGFGNGAVTGVLCGIAMYLLALSQASPHAFMLGVCVTLAMIGSCVISGISGALVPLGLKKLGFDPATAS